MMEKGNVQPDRGDLQDESDDRESQVDEPIGSGPTSNQRPKDPWRAFFELADELDDAESPTL